MHFIIEYAIQNTLIAALFAVIVYFVTRVWRNPPIAHLLWLLVLLKLIAPPLVALHWFPATMTRELTVPAPSFFADEGLSNQNPSPPGETSRQPSALRMLTPNHALEEASIAASVVPFWRRALRIVVMGWIIGSIVMAVVTLVRVIRFDRRVRGTLPASGSIQRLSDHIAGKFEIRSPPDIRYCQGIAVPLVWCVGRHPVILLPTKMIQEFDRIQIGMVLAHELAHVRRRDHWIRFAEMLITVLYWWNPVVWAVRPQLHQNEDLCCDAWVRWAFPGSTQRYAEVVLKTAESLRPAQVTARLLPASPFLRSLSLRTRIQMILESRFTPRLSNRTACVAFVLAAFVLPCFFQARNARAAEGQVVAKSPEAKPQPPATSEFPYQVEFEQGATKFADGDDITILEIRGTEKTFVRGNLYWIRGTYKLKSQPKAMLAAYTTAKRREDAKSRSWKFQTMNLEKGSGTFTLFLPMACEGWPHVSFYADGHGIGGNYFGTGDSVLRKWWGSN